MNFIAIVLTLILSLFSTSVMTYISLATPIGPWIAPTLVLIAVLISKFLLISENQLMRTVGLATAGGSIGGILATAVGFSFPTLYFLKPLLFNEWLVNPFYFSVILGSLSLAAGSFGYLIVTLFEEKFLIQEQLAFPIGQLTFKLLSAGNSIRKAYELSAGIVSCLFFSLFQGGFYGIEGMGKTLSIISPHVLGFINLPGLQMRLDTLPMLVSIGFITGHVIALPLTVGTFSKIALIDPLNFLFFPQLKSEYFLLAFCSGMVLIGALQSFWELIPSLISFFKKKSINNINELPSLSPFKQKNYGESIIILSFIMLFLWWFNFSITSQCYLLIGSFLCIYNISLIAGKMGIAPLGRFATFVMIPGLLLVGVDAVKVTFMATFVEISCGVAVDLLFGRKMAQFAQLNKSEVRTYQLLGLIISSCVIGIVFWLFTQHFGLGSEILMAQRAKSRALLVQITDFDWIVLTCGALFGWLLKKIKINPVMVLGGLLMAPNISMALIIGGFLALLVKNKEQWEPFWSGVFAANSIIELLKTVF